MDAVGARLKYLRDSRRLKQEELAAAINCSRFSVSNYENGRTLPHDMIISYANYFDVSADWLLGLTTEQQRERDPLSKSIDQLALLVEGSGGEPVTSAHFARLVAHCLAYYQRGAPAGNVPIDVLRQLLLSLDAVMGMLSGGSLVDIITATNALASAGLRAQDIMAEYVKRNP